MSCRGLATLSTAALLASAGALVAQETAVSAELRDSLHELSRPDLQREEATVRKQIERSLEDLDEVLALPDATAEQLAEAYGRLGRLYFLYDVNDLAPIALRNAIRLQPDDYRWTYYLAAHQTFEGELEEAELHLRRVAAARPGDLPTRIRLADLLLDQGEEEEAEESYRLALELDPDSAAAYAGLGRLAHRRGQHEEATDLLGRALELQPEADSLHHVLGLVYRSLGDLDLARQHLGKNKQGRLTFPDPLIEEMSLENLSAEAYFHAAREVMGRGDTEEATRFWRTYLRIKPDDPVVHHNLGVALLSKGNWEEGLAILRRSVELDPNYRGGHFSLGSALAEQGRYREALPHYERAHQLDPEEPFIHADWATLLAKLGQTDRALAELETLLADDPQQEYTQVKYGAVLVQGGHLAQAETVLRSLPGSGGLEKTERAEASYHLGVMAQNRGDLEAARRHLAAAVDLDPRSAEGNAAWAKQLARDGRFEDGAQFFDLALELDPENDRLHFERAMALILGEMYERALAALEASLQARPESVALSHALARLLATCPDPEVRNGSRAVALAERVMAAELTLDHAETLAMAFAEVGRFGEAVQLQQRVIEQAERTGGAPGVNRSRQLGRLARYERGEVVRAPWRDS